jgi:D-alanyl-D-alanine carboxypeptidase
LTDFGARRVWSLSILLLATLAFLTGCGDDPTFNPELAKELQSQVDRDRTGYRVPAISAAVVLPDGSVWTGASGRADTKSGRKVNTGTVFAIGSITKTFVSALALRLVEDGELSLDDPIGKWVPEFPRSKGSSASLRQLLRHTSGIYNYTDNPTFGKAVEQGRLPWTPERTLQYVKAPYFPPGKDFRYSNTNYILLGMVIERATGRPLPEQIRTRLLEPLGLERIYLQAGSLRFADIAHGYTAISHDLPHKDVSDGTMLVPNARSSQWAWAAGGMAADARSVAVWADSLFGGRVLEETSLDEMIDVRDTGGGFDYGLGVGGTESASGSKKMLGHDGAIDGFQSEMWYLPSEDVTIVVLVNDDTTRIWNIRDNMLDTVLSHLTE